MISVGRSSTSNLARENDDKMSQSVRSGYLLVHLSRLLQLFDYLSIVVSVSYELVGDGKRATKIKSERERIF